MMQEAEKDASSAGSEMQKMGTEAEKEMDSPSVREDEHKVSGEFDMDIKKMGFRRLQSTDAGFTGFAADATAQNSMKETVAKMAKKNVNKVKVTSTEVPYEESEGEGTATARRLGMKSKAKVAYEVAADNSSDADAVRSSLNSYSPSDVSDEASSQLSADGASGYDVSCNAHAVTSTVSGKLKMTVAKNYRRLAEEAPGAVQALAGEVAELSSTSAPTATLPAIATLPPVPTLPPLATLPPVTPLTIAPLVTAAPPTTVTTTEVCFATDDRSYTAVKEGVAGLANVDPESVATRSAEMDHDHVTARRLHEGDDHDHIEVQYWIEVWNDTQAQAVHDALKGLSANETAAAINAKLALHGMPEYAVLVDEKEVALPVSNASGGKSALSIILGVVAVIAIAACGVAGYMLLCKSKKTSKSRGHKLAKAEIKEAPSEELQPLTAEVASPTASLNQPSLAAPGYGYQMTPMSSYAPAATPSYGYQYQNYPTYPMTTGYATPGAMPSMMPTPGYQQVQAPYQMVAPEYQQVQMLQSPYYQTPGYLPQV
eukprot:CAMPEP_0197644192 /NCGR_PEP_ID=MMETSP1338-20131121/17251_1 /TAXON_ID=43686 ORGANISM="Pelagodinium beii, Strain RCC1491" /NCGR_SAMPLE_ID=MMETSP1338 /ASSEMBLY_ACC=CAM_ASM_000754 /LENGTH=541 /DNA_ID=CAMNT_0043217551 /DNA_START=137 /DNA_END=1762 /DNA_ORIENTATION=-